MHAVVVTVKVGNVEEARPKLLEQVVPAVSQAPGFVAGYWLEPIDGHGLSVVVFESEEAAKVAAENVQPPSSVTLESVEVREVVASA
jgi:hypothetical protein